MSMKFRVEHNFIIYVFCNVIRDPVERGGAEGGERERRLLHLGPAWQCESKLKRRCGFGQMAAQADV